MDGSNAVYLDKTELTAGQDEIENLQAGVVEEWEGEGEDRWSRLVEMERRGMTKSGINLITVGEKAVSSGRVPSFLCFLPSFEVIQDLLGVGVQ